MRYVHSNTMSREEIALADADRMAQDLYDHLTCAGLRTGLWPASSPDKLVETPGYKLDDAFAAIEEYIATWREVMS